MATPTKIQDRLRTILQKRSKKLTQAETAILEDVGILENGVGGLMDVILRNYTLASTSTLIKEYNFTKDEAERFIKLSVTKFEEMMNSIPEKMH